MIRVTPAALLLCAFVALGQQPDPKLTFEVASIKPAAPQAPGRMMMGGGGGPGTPDPGQMRFNNMPLRLLITRAYNVQPFQVSGPGWLDSERFDIIAKVPHGATKEDAAVMLQNLLADRFKLKLHKESKEAPLYELVVAKSGPKLKEAEKTATAAAPAEGDGPGAPPPGPPRMGKDGFPADRGRPGGLNMMMMMSNGSMRTRMQGNAVTTATLADRLSMVMGRPVVDKTGLKGTYDITMDFTPEGLGMMRGGPMMMGPPKGAEGPGGPGGGGPGAEAPRDSNDSGPTVFTALQEQLGLKLESRKGPVDLLVVDSAEKTPTEN